VQIQEGNNSFDLWIKVKGFGHTMGERCSSTLLPTRKHKHYHKFDDWIQKKPIHLRLDNKGRLFADIFFEKESPAKKEVGSIIGLDCGYKKLAVLSTGQRVGERLVQKIEKISRKKQGSKAFKRALCERNNYICAEVKKINLSDLQTIVVENLKNVKHKSKGKIARKVMNKLQRWTYPYFLSRLEQRGQISGVHVAYVNPAYTSQKCEKCGSIHKENRVGELFLCRECGYAEDADYNASRNILNRFLTGEAFGPCLENSV
jgi:IS605 OrfB family transposase